MKKKLIIGILAHVDAGKTTLSEALLYRSGKIRKQGRVDHKNTYLDTHAVERERGITIFSKLVQSLNASLSIVVALSEIFTCVNWEHPANAPQRIT